jgi:hypothetical protein
MRGESLLQGRTSIIEVIDHPRLDERLFWIPLAHQRSTRLAEDRSDSAAKTFWPQNDFLEHSLFESRFVQYRYRCWAADRFRVLLWAL